MMTTAIYIIVTFILTLQIGFAVDISKIKKEVEKLNRKDGDGDGNDRV